MLRYWIEQEYYRLQVVEQWPDSAYKCAILAAISSKIRSLADQLPPALTSNAIAETSPE